MIEIPPNAILARLQTVKDDLETPDDWKTIPALTEKEAKVYRVKKTLLTFDGVFKYSSIRIEGVVPIYAESVCIGCIGEVEVNGEEIVVELIIDYHTPERLELENGELKLEPVIKDDVWNGQPLYGSNLLSRVNLKK